MDFVSSGSAHVTKAWLPILRLILYAMAPEHDHQTHEACDGDVMGVDHLLTSQYRCYYTSVHADRKDDRSKGLDGLEDEELPYRATQ